MSNEIVRASEVSFNEGLMRLAVVHKKEVTFRYVKDAGGTIEQRTLIPSGVTKNNTGTVRFTGYDPDREGLRSFRIDRMRGEVSVA